jgi:glycosyltransferase involved in cell wall biosynthesis
MSRFPKVTETFILYEILALEQVGLETEVYPLLRHREAVTQPEAAPVVARAHYQPFVSLPILRANWHFLRARPSVYIRMVLEVLRGTFGSANFFVGAIGTLPKAVRFAYEMERCGVTHVHAHFATHPTVAALIIHRLTGIPYSFTAHGSDLHVDRRMLDRKLAAAAFAVTCSKFNKQVMVDACGEADRDTIRDKIRVVHYGADLDLFRPEDTPRRETGSACEIVCVASFEEVKGHKYLVEACGHLARRGVDYRCHLIGDGPERQDVEARVADAGLTNRFVFHGVLKRAEVARHLRSSDVKVLASFPTRSGKREGMPNVLIEAMAAGLPVVSTRLTGIPELVDSGRTGILVPPADAVALADALEELGRDAELRRRMGAAGREKALRSFDRRANATTLAKLFGLNGDGQDTQRSSRSEMRGGTTGKGRRVSTASSKGAR